MRQMVNLYSAFYFVVIEITDTVKIVEPDFKDFVNFD